MAKKYDLPPYEEYFIPAVHSLKKRGGSATIEELEIDVAESLNLSDKARATLHGDGPRTEFQYQLAWVRTYLKFYGAAENSERGIWHLTPRGAALSDGEVRGIWRNVNAEKRKKRKAERSETSPEAEQELPELSWKERLLDSLLAMKPDAFERLCQRVLRESGFTKVEITGRSGDGGIDGVGVLRLNLLSFHVLFQCKRWKGSVGASTVRDFRGAMVGRADKGLIITTGNFSADARREATRDGAPAIDLVDGDSLSDLLKTLKIGVTVALVEEVSVDETVFATM